MFNIPLFPAQASSYSGEVDALYFFILAVTVFFTLAVSLAVLYLAIRYRRRNQDDVGAPIHGSLALELTWTIIPLVIALGIFFWSAKVYFTVSKPPSQAMEVYAVGKRWMWKFQHVTGQREINELHVPLGQPVKILIGSEDVLHSLYFPSFRVKMDAVPGKWTSLWFQPTQTGQFHIFCAEYCGNNHSGMIGTVVVMEPRDFQAWLAGGRSEGPPAAVGEKLFSQLACNTCHLDNNTGRGPSLKNVVGTQVRLQGGQTATVDDNYIRESILTPQAKLVEGYQPLMPTFQGLVTEESVMQLLAYIKSMSAPPAAPAAGAPPAPAAAPASGPAKKLDE
ncbi:MAG: cytochrome c oxidase subunit II [Vicinamibacterales bacterium]